MKDEGLRRQKTVKHRNAAKLRRLSGLVVVAWLGGLLVALMVIKALTGLLLHEPFWPLFRTPRVNPSPAYLDIVKVGLSVVAGMGGIVALVVAYRRQIHLERDDAGYREEQKFYRDRYSSAAEQLGNEHAAVRLAGVYAMANLADDWEDQRQQCVDVLCAYLRLPWPGEDGEVAMQTTVEDAFPKTGHTGDPDFEQFETDHRVTKTYTGRPGEAEVRQTITAVLSEHLQPSALISWSPLDLNLRNAHLPNANFIGAKFAGLLQFTDATFSGATSFIKARFAGEIVDFGGALFKGDYADFDKAIFSGTSLYFGGAVFACESNRFRQVIFSGKFANFDHAKFSGRTTSFKYAEFCGESASFAGATFSSAITDFSDASFSGANTEFNGSSFYGESIRASDIRFLEHCSFLGAEFPRSQNPFLSSPQSGQTHGGSH